MNEAVLQCRNLSKIFHDVGQPITVFQEIDLQVDAGDSVAIIGRSGAGKSTLLHVLGGLDQATKGEVLINGTNIQQLSEKQRSKVRNKNLGFIYQFHHLLPEFTALENVSIPLLLGEADVETAQEKAKDILEKVALGQRLSHKVAQLSGGERQRVAIARALVTQPLCVLADEPTGNLDKQTADQVFKMMLDLNRQLHTSLIIVTHDEELAKRMDRVFILEEGSLAPV